MPDVVWLTSAYPWDGAPPGHGFFRTQVQALTRAGLAVTVVAPTPAAPWPLPRLGARWRAYAQAPRRQQDGAAAILRPRFPNMFGEPRWAFPDRLRAAAAWRTRRDWQGADLIHGHFATTAIATWRLARRAGLPFVLTFHGGDMNSWPDDHPDRVGDLRAACRAAGAVIAVSDALVDRIRDVTGVDAIHLPLGVDHAALAAEAPSRAEARRSLDLPADRVLVLFVGNLLAAKGIAEFAAAILELGQPYIGVLVGAGPLAGTGLGDPRAGGCLLYRGGLPHAQVMRHMAAADMLVLPSYTEGLPTVLIEAGSIGLPVIASRVGGIPTLLANDRGMVLDEISAEAVAAAIRATHADPDAARARAERLRAHVHGAHDVDTNAAALAKVYRSVVGSVPSVGPAG